MEPKHYELELPSGSKVTFREPLNADRQKVVGILKPEDKMPIDEALAAYCIVSVNGNPPADPDFRYRLSGWTIKDTQMYVAVWLDMFTLTEDGLTEAREKAKNLLRSGTAAISA